MTREQKLVRWRDAFRVVNEALAAVAPQIAAANAAWSAHERGRGEGRVR